MNKTNGQIAKLPVQDLSKLGQEPKVTITLKGNNIDIQSDKLDSLQIVGLLYSALKLLTK